MPTATRARVSSKGRYAPRIGLMPNILPLPPAFVVRNRPLPDVNHERSPEMQRMCRKLKRDGSECPHKAHMYSVYCKRHQL